MRKLIFMVIALAMTHLATSQTADPELIGSSGDSFTNDTPCWRELVARAATELQARASGGY